MANIDGAASEGGPAKLRQYDFWHPPVKSAGEPGRGRPPGWGF